MNTSLDHDNLGNYSKTLSNERETLTKLSSTLKYESKEKERIKIPVFYADL